MNTWYRRLEARLVSTFSNVPFLYGLVIALGCLIQGMAGTAAVMPASERTVAVAAGSIEEESLGDEAQLVGVIPLPDGTFLVVGQEETGLFLMRLKKDGQPDASFGSAGKVPLGKKGNPLAIR